MKLTNAQIELFGSSETVKKFYGAHFPVKYTMKIKLQREALQTVTKVYMEIKKEAVLRYCEKDDKGAPIAKNNQYSFKGENALKFSAEFDELLKQEVEVDTEKVIIPEGVFDKAGNWSVNDLDILAPFIEISSSE